MLLDAGANGGHKMLAFYLFSHFRFGKFSCKIVVSTLTSQRLERTLTQDSMEGIICYSFNDHLLLEEALEAIGLSNIRGFYAVPYVWGDI
jgi:hypothetical protein